MDDGGDAYIHTHTLYKYIMAACLGVPCRKMHGLGTKAPTTPGPLTPCAQWGGGEVMAVMHALQRLW